MIFEMAYVVGLIGSKRNLLGLQSSVNFLSKLPARGAGWSIKYLFCAVRGSIAPTRGAP